MAFLKYNNLWENEFGNTFAERDKLQDININQLKFQVHDTYRKNEKITTIFEPIDDSDLINKAYPDEKQRKVYCHFLLLEKDYNGVKLQYKKQSVEEFIIQRAMKTTMQTLYDKGLVDDF